MDVNIYKLWNMNEHDIPSGKLTQLLQMAQSKQWLFSHEKWVGSFQFVMLVRLPEGNMMGYIGLYGYIGS